MFLHGRFNSTHHVYTCYHIIIIIIIIIIINIIIIITIITCITYYYYYYLYYLYTLTHTYTHTYTRTNTHTHTYTHTNCNTTSHTHLVVSWFSTQKFMILRALELIDDKMTFWTLIASQILTKCTNIPVGPLELTRKTIGIYWILFTSTAMRSCR